MSDIIRCHDCGIKWYQIILSGFISGIKWYQIILRGFICGIKWYQEFQIRFGSGIKWYQSIFDINRVKELNISDCKIPKCLKALLLLLLLLLEYSFLVYCTGVVSSHTTPPDHNQFSEKFFVPRSSFKPFYQVV